MRTDPGAQQTARHLVPVDGHDAHGSHGAPDPAHRRRQEVNEVFFDDVRVPADRLVGEENKGWTYAKFLLGNERTTNAGIGLIKTRIGRIKRIAGALLAEPLFRARLTRLEVETTALEMSVLRVLAREESLPRGTPDPVSSVLKLKGSELQQEATELLVDLLGPAALPYREREVPTVRRRAGGCAGRVPHVLQLAQGIDLRRVQRGAARHHRQGDSEALRREPGGSGADRRATMLAETVDGLFDKTYDANARLALLASRRMGGVETIWQQYAEMGLLGLTVEEQYGGAGMGGAELAVVLESFGRSLVLEPYFATVVLGASLVSAAGSPDQRQEILPGVCAGTALLALAHTEANSRWSLTDIAATAQPDGDGWSVDAREDRGAGRRHRRPDRRHRAYA